ncbi:MAG TPA: ATP-binding protein [Casimicrobiaceae bacterium]|nr:ATP-binding protein [Casimicrobiaceae bacterium]
MSTEPPVQRTTAQQRADDVLAALPAVVWELGADGNTQFVSDSAVAMLGYPLDAWRVSPGLWIEIAHPDDRARAARALEDVGRSGRRSTLAVRWRGRAGNTLHVDVTLDALRDASGTVSAVRGCAVDVTRRRQLETEVARCRDLLEQGARRAVLNDLAGALAHEMNQPLNAIMNQAEAARILLFQKPTPFDELRATLDEIVAADRRADGIVERARGLIDPARRQWCVVDMDGVVNEALALMGTDAILRGMRLAADPAGVPLRVMGEPQQLLQVVLNLVGNALDAAGEGGRVDVTLAAVGASSVAVAVTDDGPGIAAGLLPHAFEAFVSTKEGSLGLGLDIASSIVQAHGGAMWAANGRGGGALVAFGLPAVPGGREDESAGRAPREA